MGMVELALVACFLVVILPMVSSSSEGSKEIDQWLQELTHAKQKATHLHFYLHDTFSGRNPTVVEVAQSNMTHSSPTLFGLMNVMDDPLTEGPESTSKEVGRAQGFYGSSGQKEMGLLMAMSLVFTTGKFNGSSLTILGRNPAMEPHRELPIIGGSGVFRLARGFAALKTYYYNASNGDAIVEYNVAVIHY
ncbi:hypothetical protein P3X46_033558 [Hevea brasiliensis]|uniref:Dirigent protein n=1 Tax=Hevea brasiliensis TaxID=3981 RepID=A0ABQ9KBM9_HEVBR|nr:dirigent protein 23-like [Hevea brasiliensis]KAJ9132721.1 hypothetical protein P3X46_033558 [Hevea brasiliensis]